VAPGLFLMSIYLGGGMKSSILTYSTPKGTVKLSFDTSGLRVILDDEVIAIFGIEMVWDTAKEWLAGIITTKQDVGLRRRKLEARIVKASSFAISQTINYVN